MKRVHSPSLVAGSRVPGAATNRVIARGWSVAALVRGLLGEGSMRARARGFTLLEMMVVVAIIGLLAVILVPYGRSVNQASSFASATWELSLRAAALRARAIANNKDFLLLVVDTGDAAGCRWDQRKCGKGIVFSAPTTDFAVNDFDPDPPYTTLSYEEEFQLPRNSQFDTGTAFAFPAPFASVTAMDPELLADCRGARKCFAIRYQLDGTVVPLAKSPPLTSTKGGFTFLLKPVEAESAAAQRRALLVTFPTGIVKTAAF